MKIGWSNFAIRRHQSGTGYSFFEGSREELVEIVRQHWDKRVKGAGTDSIDKVCIVPVPSNYFRTTKIHIEDATNIVGKIVRRQAHEEPYVRLEADGATVNCRFAKVVLYSANELLKNNGERSGDYDWEIVCIIASDMEDEPMTPLTMARNQLGLAGGTPRTYTSEEWATAVHYWSQFVSCKSND